MKAAQCNVSLRPLRPPSALQMFVGWSRAGIVLIVVLTFVCQASPAFAAMTIMEAADKINGLTPKLMPQQTIFVGTFKASQPREFIWSQQVAEYYLPSTPDFKKVENGGPVHPLHSTMITSYNVKYQFKVQDKPSGLTATLSTPDANGQMVNKEATWSGDTATVTFNPGRASPPQVVNFRLNGVTVGGINIRPIIAAELGAYVVPRLLMTVIYEPPGAQSKAKYGTSSTAGSTMCWDFARSGGVVTAITENTFVDTIDKTGKAIKAIASVASVVTGGTNPYIEAAKGVGEVLGQFNAVIGNTDISTTSTKSYSSSTCQGVALSLDNWYDTDPTDGKNYPGQGDLFVILEDVLFVYAFVDGRVALMPWGYKYARKLWSSQLDGYLSAALATQYRQLDPWFNEAINPASHRPKGFVSGRLRGPRFIQRPSMACDIGGGEGAGEQTENFSSSGVTVTNTTTVVTKVTGLMAEFMGSAGESSQSISYSTSKTNWTVNAQYAEVYLNCVESEGAFVVNRYFDTLLGTFFTVKGAPIYYIAGFVNNNAGQPLPNQTVTLRMGAQNYTAVTNQRGQFKFRLTAVPKGSGSLSVGASAVPVNYTGAPITNLRLTVGAPATGPAMGQGPVGGAPGPALGGPAARMQGPAPVPPPCCGITSIDVRAGMVTAKAKRTGETFRFAVKDPGLLKTLRTGQPVYANSATKQVSLDGVKICCQIISATQSGAAPAMGSSASAASSGSKPKDPPPKTRGSEIKASEGDTAKAIRGRPATGAKGGESVNSLRSIGNRVKGMGSQVGSLQARLNQAGWNSALQSQINSLRGGYTALQQEAGKFHAKNRGSNFQAGIQFSNDLQLRLNEINLAMNNLGRARDASSADRALSQMSVSLNSILKTIETLPPCCTEGICCHVGFK